MPSRVILDLPAGVQAEQLAEALQTLGISVRHCTEPEQARKSDKSPRGAHLTQTERKIVALFLRHDRVRQIAQIMGVGQSTIKTHIHNIFEKLEVGSRACAVGRAIQLGLLSFDDLTAPSPQSKPAATEKINRLVDSTNP
jgi:DNA-binding CsgD family transcriptional regulator